MNAAPLDEPDIQLDHLWIVGPPAPITTPSAWCWSRRKRALDLVLGIAVLSLALPVIALLSAISFVTYRATPFFRQRRCGADEAEFQVMKIRSLPSSYPTRHGRHPIVDHEFTRWSNFLRDSHLDELPQVFNIIGGSMSAVGPRPMINEVVEELEPIDRKTRATVKPGLTGPWQISTIGSVALHDHPELDGRYVDRATFLTDLRIIWLTLLGLLGKRAMEPDELIEHLSWR